MTGRWSLLRSRLPTQSLSLTDLAHVLSRHLKVSCHALQWDEISAQHHFLSILLHHFATLSPSRPQQGSTRSASLKQQFFSPEASCKTPYSKLRRPFYYPKTRICHRGATEAPHCTVLSREQPSPAGPLSHMVSGRAKKESSVGIIRDSHT